MVDTLVTHFDWAPLRRQTVGFDNIFTLMDKFLDDSYTALPNYHLIIFINLKMEVIIQLNLQ